MTQVKILNQKEVASILDMKHVVEAVEKAYAYKCEGQAELFPLVCHSFDDGREEMDIKSGSVDGAGVFGMKLVSAFVGNSEKGLPRLMGTILIFDRETGVLRSIMDGGCITNMRTGAAGAVGCKYLARPESERLLLVGTGAQGPNLIAATLEVMENVKEIFVCNPHSESKAEKFCAEAPQLLEKTFFAKYSSEHRQLLQERAKVSWIPFSDLEAACRRADMILTATPSRKPLIRKEWIKAGTHLSCIGSDMEGKQEVDEKLVQAARVFCDDRKQVMNVGECEKAVKAGLVQPEEITELGDVILGKAKGRQSAEEITLFDSTGIALQDLMNASMITDLAEERGLGVTVEL